MSKNNGAMETIESIARRNRVSIWAVERAVGRLGARPVRRFGTVRIFDLPTTNAIEGELRRVAAKRARFAPAGA